MTRQDKRPRQNAGKALRADIKLHLPVHMFSRIQSMANDCGVPCETLIKVWAAEKVLNRRTASQRFGRDGR